MAITTPHQYWRSNPRPRHWATLPNLKVNSFQGSQEQFNTFTGILDPSDHKKALNSLRKMFINTSTNFHSNPVDLSQTPWRTWTPRPYPAWKAEENGMASVNSQQWWKSGQKGPVWPTTEILPYWAHLPPSILPLGAEVSKTKKGGAQKFLNLLTSQEKKASFWYLSKQWKYNLVVWV